MKVSVIILAGGSGKRLGDSVPKQFLKLSGVPIFIHTIKEFKKCNFVTSITLSVSKEVEDWYNSNNVKSLSETVYGLVDNIKYCNTTRVTDSLEFISNNCNDDTIVIAHDAVRPLLGSRIIEDGISILSSNNNTIAIPTYKIQESIVKVDNSYIIDGANRNEVVLNQTPEFYRGATVANIATECLNNFSNDYDEYGSIYWAIGKVPILKIEGEACNIKITKAHDLVIAERLFEFVNNTWPDPVLTGKEKVLLIGSRSGIGTEIKKELERLAVNTYCLNRPEFDALDYKSLTNSELYREYDACIYLPHIMYGTRDDVYKVNLFVPQMLIEKSHYILKQHGSFLVFGSSSAYKGREDVPCDYSASKAALINYVESISPVLYRSYGIHLNCLCPRKTNTRMHTTIRKDQVLSPESVALQAIKMIFCKNRFGEIYNMR